MNANNNKIYINDKNNHLKTKNNHKCQEELLMNSC